MALNSRKEKSLRAVHDGPTDKDGGLRLADEARGEFNAGFSLRVRSGVPLILFSLFLIHLPVAVCQYY